MLSKAKQRASSPLARESGAQTKAPLQGKTSAPAKASAQTLASRVDELERTLERVRVAYETYFLGLERRAPELARQQLHHKLLELQSVPIANTAVRFRYQNLLQRFTQLGGHWNRTMREIEAGTYRRDVLKAARRMTERDGSTGE